MSEAAAAEARLQAWNAVQWLARLARSYAGDDAPLRWIAPARIVTPEIAPGIEVGLELSTLILQFDEDGAPSPHPLVLDDKSSSEVEAWILVEMLHRGIERERFSKALPYAPAQLMSGEEPKYAAHGLTDALRGFAEEMTAAADTLLRTRELVADAGGLVCWAEPLAIGFTVTAADVPLEVAYASGTGGDLRAGFRVARGADVWDLPRDVSAADTAADLAALVTKARRAAR